MSKRSFFVGLLLLLSLCAPLAAPRQDALAHLGAGLELFDRQRYAEAAKEFERALEINPQLDDARYHLAISLFKRRQFHEARKRLETLEASGYRKEWVAYYFGRIDLVEGNTDAAIARFESLERPEPLFDELYYLGVAYLRKGQPEKAADSLRRQAAFNPRDFRAHDQLARAYVKMGRPEEAEREFGESRRLHEYYDEGKKEITECRALLSAGKADEAWEACRSVLETDDVDKLVAVGMLFGEFASYDRALELFRKALALDPDSPEINYDAGFTYFRMKDYAGARKFLEAAARLRPNFFEAVALYGTVLYLLREDATAAEVLRRAHLLHPDDQAVTKLLAEVERAAPR